MENTYSLEEAVELAKNHIRHYNYWHRNKYHLSDDIQVMLDWFIDKDFKLKSFYNIVEFVYDVHVGESDEDFDTIMWYFSESHVDNIVMDCEKRSFLRYAKKHADEKTYEWIKKMLNE